MSAEKKDSVPSADPLPSGIARRSFLQYLSVAFAASALPEMIACATDVGGPELGESASLETEGLPAVAWLDVVRPQDLVALGIGYAGLTIDAVTRTFRRAGGPAYFYLRFPPQHILEQATAGLQPTPSPLGSRAADPSVVAFHIADTLPSVPYSVSGVLAACAGAQLVVSRNAVPADWTAGAAAGSSPATLSAARIDRHLAARDPAASTRVAARAAARIDRVIPPPPPPPPGLPQRPDATQTSLELPHRLILSPSVLGAFTHRATPSAADPTQPTELWHTRLGVRSPDGSVDERSAANRTVRALWTRDPGFQANKPDSVPRGGDPFPTIGGGDPVPSGRDRDHLVHLTSDFALAQDLGGVPPTYVPRAITVDRLMLSSLGGYLDAHLDLDDQASWLTGHDLLLGWSERIAGGRDVHVQVVHAGWLYPFGAPAVLVDVIERSADPMLPNVAVGTLCEYQILLIRRAVTTFPNDVPHLRSPFVSIEHTQRVFKCRVDGRKVVQDALTLAPIYAPITALDRAGHPVRFEVPMMFVEGAPPSDASATAADCAGYNAAFAAGAPTPKGPTLAMGGQRLAFADPTHGLEDTTYETIQLDLGLEATSGYAPAIVPVVSNVQLNVEAIRHLTGSDASTPVQFHASYATSGFDPAGNPSELLFKADRPTSAAFTKNAGNSGGLVAPDLSVDGLSRKMGPVGGAGGASLAAGRFDPAEFFGGALPKLFGVLDLKSLVSAVDSGALGTLERDAAAFAPKLVTEAYDRLQRVVAELQGLQRRAQQAQQQASDVTSATNAVLAAVQACLDDVGPAKLFAGGITQLTGFVPPGSSATPPSPCHAVTLLDALVTLETACGASSSLAYGVKRDVLAQVTRVRAALGAAQTIASDLGRAIDKISQGLGALKDFQAKLTWQPLLQKELSFAPIGHLALRNPRGLTLSANLTRKAHEGGGGPGADIFCSLDDFGIVLGDVTFDFDHLAFHAAPQQKIAVDVVFRGVTFDGPLAFLNQLKSLIPMDGFSDPPHVSVDSGGVHAGFSLALPSLAIGLFTLQNIKFDATVTVPLLGNGPLSFDFDFCSREHPFILTVAMLGGGGWFGMTVSVNGLDRLEAGFEFGATLAMDLVVAQGSVSVNVGIYVTLDATRSASINGFLRIHGQMEILGLIGVSITLYMVLSYADHKVTGTATIVIEVDIAFFSQSVSLTYSKSFGSDNQDPTLWEVMQPAQLPDGTAYVPWNEYCVAFA